MTSDKTIALFIVPDATLVTSELVISYGPLIYVNDLHQVGKPVNDDGLLSVYYMHYI